MVRSAAINRIAEESGLSCTITDEDTALVRMASPEDKQKIMQMLTSKYDIDEVKVFEPSLNDIFVEYAGEGENQDEAV